MLKKILILSKPRSGSTVLVHQLAKLFGYPPMNEPYGDEYRRMLTMDKMVTKFVFTSLNLWNDIKDLIFEVDWDLVILLRRNDNESMLSYSQLFNTSNFSVWSNKNSHKPYIIDKNKKISNHVRKLYKDANNLFEDVLGMNKNIVELTYDNLYHKDINIRIKELNKVIDIYKIDELVREDVLDKMNPIHRYGKEDIKDLI